MIEVVVLQHADCETPGAIEDALEAAGIGRRFVRAFEGQPVPPALGEDAGLVVMGGPMGVYEQERYPYLRDEMRLIEQALGAGKPVLGVCLGSQLLAAVLGARVHPGPQKEIGWHEVSLAGDARDDALWHNVADHFVAFHWHGDVFELPPGGVSLAHSELTQQQAFRHGRNAYGLLFHIEVDQPMVQRMVATFRDELSKAAVDGNAILRDSGHHLPGLQAVAATVFGRWAALLEVA